MHKIRKFVPRISKETERAFLAHQLSINRLRSAKALIQATVFLKPPKQIGNFLDAIVAKGPFKGIKSDAYPEITNSDFQELRNDVDNYLVKKGQELEKKENKRQGKQKAEASTSSAQPPAENTVYSALPTGFEELRQSIENLTIQYDEQTRLPTPFPQVVPKVNLQAFFGEQAVTDEQVEEYDLAPESDTEKDNEDKRTEVGELSRPPTPHLDIDVDEDQPEIQIQPQVQLPLPPIVQLPQVQPQVQPPPPQNLLPPQQPDDEEEMSQAHYPTFDGTNPRKWIAELELAFIANNIAANADARRIGIAALNLGPARMWYMTLANQPAQWNQANVGFKQIFLAKYAANGNRAQAAQQAFSRMQKTTESVNDYLNALQGMWMECGDANMPEWLKVNQFVNGLLPQLRMPVLQQAPQTMNDAVQYATNCYYAMQSTIQPANAIDTTYQTMLAAVQELLKETRNNNNQRGNDGNSNNNNQFQPRQRQEMRNTACYYCGKRGHAYRNCRILALHRRENREQQWAMPQRNQGPQGKGQPRH